MTAVEPSGENTPVLDDEEGDLLEQFRNVTGDEPTGGDESGDEPPEPPAEEPPAPQIPEGYIDLLGQQLPRDEAERLLQFRQWGQANPQRLTEFDAYLRGELQLTPPQQAPSTPEEDPLADVDPAIRSELEQLREQQGQLTQLTQQQYLAQLEAGVTRAREAVQKERQLSDEEMERLTQETAKMAIMPSLMSQYQDAEQAAQQALNLVYWQIPEFRDREVGRAVESASNQRSRQEKQSKLAGNSGSAPRETPVPETPEARKEAMISEIADAMNQ